MTAALAVVGLLAPRRLEALRDAHDLRRMEGAAVQRALAELGRRLPALRAHGTAVFERDRLHAELILDHGAARSVGRQAGYAAALSAATALLAPAAVLGAGAWWARHGVPAPGAVTAASAAALAGTLAVDRLARWGRGAQEARRLFAEIARTLAVLQAPREGRSAAAPVSGVLAAEGVSAYDPATGARIAGVDASIIFPAHVALAGDGAGGARVFAALVGGQLDPAAGRLTFGGVEIAAMRPSERARRIAFAGGRTTLLPGSLRQNLLYGCPDPDASDIEPRLAEAAAAAGLAALIEARGLAGAL